MHLANLKLTPERRRRWTGFAVALTVTFTVCDAQQISLSPSAADLLSLASHVSVRTILPEQKAPPVLSPLRITLQTNASRKQGSVPVRAFDGSKCFRYSLVAPPSWLNNLSSQAYSGKRTRDPPLMDPPIFC